MTHRFLISTTIEISCAYSTVTTLLAQMAAPGVTPNAPVSDDAETMDETPCNMLKRKLDMPVSTLEDMARTCVDINVYLSRDNVIATHRTTTSRVYSESKTEKPCGA